MADVLVWRGVAVASTVAVGVAWTVGCMVAVGDGATAVSVGCGLGSAVAVAVGVMATESARVLFVPFAPELSPCPTPSGDALSVWVDAGNGSGARSTFGFAISVVSTVSVAVSDAVSD